MANDDPTPDSEAVWKRPAWITAIVGVISAFLTVPGVVGSYLEKQQDIKIAEQKVEEAKLNNTLSKQSQEFTVVQNSLAQQGTERVFLLRYFASTLDDAEAKTWAKEEVTRLDELSSLQEQLSRQQRTIAEKESQLAAMQAEGGATHELESEISNLRQQVAERDIQVTELRQKAGIGENVGISLFYWWFDLIWADDTVDGEQIEVEIGKTTHYCYSDWGPVCQRITTLTPPDQITVRGMKTLPKIQARASASDVSLQDDSLVVDVRYDCRSQGADFVCQKLAE